MSAEPPDDHTPASAARAYIRERLKAFETLLDRDRSPALRDSLRRWHDETVAGLEQRVSPSEAESFAGRINVLSLPTFWPSRPGDTKELAYVRSATSYLAGLLQDLEEAPERVLRIGSPSSPTPQAATRSGSRSGPQAAAAKDPTRVAVVHGRNAAARDGMFTFLRSLHLKPVEWEQAVKETGAASPYIGDALDALFTMSQAVVVVLTGDEEVRLRQSLRRLEDPDTFEFQSRPNVLFEAGIAFGRYPDRTVLFELGPHRGFSDVAGRNLVRFAKENDDWRNTIASRLRTAGCPVETSGNDWLNAGAADFQRAYESTGSGSTDKAVAVATDASLGWRSHAEARTRTTLRFEIRRELATSVHVENLRCVVEHPGGRGSVALATDPTPRDMGSGASMHFDYPGQFVGPTRVTAGTYRVLWESRSDPFKPPLILSDVDISPAMLPPPELEFFRVRDVAPFFVVSRDAAGTTLRRLRIGVKNATPSTISGIRVVLESLDPCPQEFPIEHELQPMGRATADFSLAPGGQSFVDIAVEHLKGQPASQDPGQLHFCLVQSLPAVISSDPERRHRLVLRVEGGRTPERCSLEVGGRLAWRMDNLMLL